MTSVSAYQLCVFCIRRPAEGSTAHAPDAGSHPELDVVHSGKRAVNGIVSLRFYSTDTSPLMTGERCFGRRATGGWRFSRPRPSTYGPLGGPDGAPRSEWEDDTQDVSHLSRWPLPRTQIHRLRPGQISRALAAQMTSHAGKPWKCSGGPGLFCVGGCRMLHGHTVVSPPCSKSQRGLSDNVTGLRFPFNHEVNVASQVSPVTSTAVWDQNTSANRQLMTETTARSGQVDLGRVSSAAMKTRSRLL